MIDLKLLYPELVGFDGLPFALQSKLSGSISDLKIQSGMSFSKWDEMRDIFEQQGLYYSPGIVATQSRKWANVEIAVEQKLYVLTLGDQGVNTKVFIETDTFDRAITFLSGWLSGKRGVHQLDGLEYFKTLLSLDDDLQYILWQWASRHRNAVNFPAMTGLLAPLFEQGLKDPVLSQVTPYTSLTTLCLGRCTDFPYLAGDYPIASPIYPFSYYHRYVVQKQNLAEAERLILLRPSAFGFVIKLKDHLCEFSNRHEELLFKGDPLELLEFIISYTHGRYDVADRQGNGWETKNAKEAVEFLRNALPANGYPSIRGSSDEIKS